MKSTIGVFLLNYKRPKELEKVIEAVKKNTVQPNVIYLFNNNPETILRFPNVITINSQENFKCIIRHAIAITRELDYGLFIDDDIAPMPKVIENFLGYSQKYPESILGYAGRILDMSHPEAPYSFALSLYREDVDKEEEVDVVLGEIHFCKITKISNSFIMRKNIPDMPLREDDIILSLSNKFIDGAKNYIIPHKDQAGIVRIPTDHAGLSMEPDHGEKRHDICRRILRWAKKNNKIQNL